MPETIGAHPDDKVMSIVKALVSIFVEDLTDTNYIGWRAPINDAVIQCGVTCILEDAAPVPPKFNGVHIVQITEATHTMLHKSITPEVKAEMTDHGLTNPPHQIMQDFNKCSRLQMSRHIDDWNYLHRV